MDDMEINLKRDFYYFYEEVIRNGRLITCSYCGGTILEGRTHKTIGDRASIVGEYKIICMECRKEFTEIRIPKDEKGYPIFSKIEYDLKYDE